MARPFHDDIDGNAGRQGIADERAPSCMAGKKLVFLLHLIRALAPVIGRDPHLFRESGKFEEFLKVIVHLLIRDDRQGLVIGEGEILVLVKDSPRDIVQVDDEAVGSLLRGDLDAVVLDVASA